MGKTLLRGILLWLAVFAAFAAMAACGDPAAPPAPVAAIVVTPGQATLKSIGETAQLSAVAKDAEGNVLEGRALTWTTSSDAVATVNANATVTAVGEGQVTVTASAEGIAGTATFTVAQEIATLEVTPANKQLVSIGETVQMVATPKDANGNPIQGRTITWQSSAPATVKVDAATGLATAMGNGTATIQAKIGALGNNVDVTVAQAAAKLVFLGAPVATQNGVNIFGVSAQVQDALGTRMFTGNYPVTVAIETNPAAGSLTGTTQVMSASANANFTAVQIDKPAKGYKLLVTSPGLAGATSAPFEIMDVPLRVDSVKVATSTLKIGGSMAYSVFITNGRGQNATQVAAQAYILQGGSTNAAAGFSIGGCGTTFGVVAPGACKSDLSANATVGAYTAGAATLKIEIREGTTLRGTVTVPITMVP